MTRLLNFFLLKILEIFVLGHAQNPHAVSGQLQASLLQPFNIGSHYNHPVSSFLYLNN